MNEISGREERFSRVGAPERLPDLSITKNLIPDDEKVAL